MIAHPYISISYIQPHRGFIFSGKCSETLQFKHQSCNETDLQEQSGSSFFRKPTCIMSVGHNALSPENA